MSATTLIPGAGEATGHSTGDHLDIPVREIMTPGVVTIPEDASLRHVFRAMARHRVHAILVMGRSTGRPLGWVTARGLLAWVNLDTALAPAHAAITERPVAIDPSAPAREALALLCTPGTTHLLVAGAAHLTPEGVLTELDVVRLVA